jgi:hypothetical protein
MRYPPSGLVIIIRTRAAPLKCRTPPGNSFSRPAATFPEIFILFSMLSAIEMLQQELSAREILCRETQAYRRRRSHVTRLGPVLKHFEAHVRAISPADNKPFMRRMSNHNTLLFVIPNGHSDNRFSSYFSRCCWHTIKIPLWTNFHHRSLLFADLRAEVDSSRRTTGRQMDCDLMACLMFFRKCATHNQLLCVVGG